MLAEQAERSNLFLPANFGDLAEANGCQFPDHVIGGDVQLRKSLFCDFR
jgi:hypothetical protein